MVAPDLFKQIGCRGRFLLTTRLKVRVLPGEPCKPQEVGGNQLAGANDSCVQLLRSGWQPGCKHGQTEHVEIYRWARCSYSSSQEEREGFRCVEVLISSWYFDSLETQDTGKISGILASPVSPQSTIPNRLLTTSYLLFRNVQKSECQKDQARRSSRALTGSRWSGRPGSISNPTGGEERFLFWGGGRVTLYTLSFSCFLWFLATDPWILPPYLPSEQRSRLGAYQTLAKIGINDKSPDDLRQKYCGNGSGAGWTNTSETVEKGHCPRVTSPQIYSFIFDLRQYSFS